MSSAFQQRGKWYARFKSPGGAWKQKATSCRSRREAERFADDLERQNERVRNGLAPAPGSLKPMTFGEAWALCDREYWSKSRNVVREPIEAHLKRHLLEPLKDLVLTEVTRGRLEALLQSKQGTLGPSSLNKLRGRVQRVFSILEERDLWAGINPAKAVKRRKVPHAERLTLSGEEAERLLATLDLTSRGQSLAPLFATALWLGLRKGELLGLQKADLDFERGTVTVRHSYGNDTTKGGHSDVLPMPPPLRPWLEAACEASKSALVFPRADGTMHSPDYDLKEILRRALGRAGIVEAWTHVCRRQGCDFKERRDFDARLPCPKCGFKLWPRAHPKKLRFHDLRHTTATLLAKNGVTATIAQRILRHSDPRLTLNIYTHTNIDDMRDAMTKFPMSIAPAKRLKQAVGAPFSDSGLLPRLLPPGHRRQEKGPGPVDFSNETEAFNQSGRQDLNLRPLGPEGASGISDGVAEGVRAAHHVELIQGARPRGPLSATQSQPNLAGFARPVLPPAPRLVSGGNFKPLLTVGEVARLLNVSRATVYALCERGELEHVRLSNAIRVAPAALEALVAQGGQ